MRAFLSGQDVTLTFSLQDDAGNPIEGISELSYRVVDQDENELVAKTVVPDYVPPDPEASITIAGSFNTVVPGDPAPSPGFSPSPSYRQVRVVELYVVNFEGTTKLTREYMIEAEEVLVEGINSFQSYAKALTVSFDLPNLPGWSGASKTERVTALIRARQNIGQLRFRYVFDAYQNIVDNTLGVADLTLATPSQYKAFPVPFKEALRRAQILEADFLLGGDDVGDIRRNGLMSMTVVKQSSSSVPGSPSRPRYASVR